MNSVAPWSSLPEFPRTGSRSFATRSTKRSTTRNLLAEAKKRRLDIDPATGEELQALAKEVMTATPDIVEKVKGLIGK